MEDACVTLDNFRRDDDDHGDGKKGKSKEGFFGVYDGHGGRLAADVVKDVMHLCLDEALRRQEFAWRGIEGGEEKGLVEAAMESGYHRHWGRGHRGGGVHRDGRMEIAGGVTPTLDPGRAFRQAYMAVDELLLKKGCMAIGSTAVTCYLKGEKDGKQVLYTANCGDARAVLVRGDKAVRLSRDHKPFEDEEVRRIRKCGGFVTNARVNGVLSVSRALGDHSMKSVIISQPHVSRHVLSHKDTALILGCDGLWDVVSDQKAVQIVNAQFERNTSAHAVAKKLVRTALALGSTDNISVVVVKLIDQHSLPSYLEI